jgi:hypothetical protein
MGNKLDVVSEVSEHAKSGEARKSLDDDDASSKISAVSGTIAASSVYEIINKAVNKEKLSIHYPKTFLKRL